MNVTVQFLAQLAVAAGTNELVVTLPANATAQDCVRHLATEFGADFTAIALREDRLHPTVLLFVDNQQIDWNTPTPLRDGTNMVLAMPIAGG